MKMASCVQLCKTWHIRSWKDGGREEILYGSNNFIYMRLRASEADKQPLGSGKDYVEWHHVHAVGLGSGDEQRHHRSLRRGVRFGFVEPLSWGLETAGTERCGDRA
jgi:hypothetical protein